MVTKRNVLIFLAGAEFFHTLTHIYMQYAASLPLKMKGIVFTSRLNGWAILINAAITVGLLIWAKKTKR